MDASARVRILELRARNIKCLREVTISMDGDIHEIRGDTGEGKTSILDAIEGALRGLDPDMVRRGANAAELELHLSTALINRIIPADGSREKLLVTDHAGNPVEHAKDFLRTICGPSAFRPIAWVQLGGGEARGRTERLRKQRDQLLEAIPLSLTDDDVVEAVRALGPDYVEALAEVNFDDVDFEQHAFVLCSALERACYEYRRLMNAKAEHAESAVAHTPAPQRPAPKVDLTTCEQRQREATEAYHAAKARCDGTNTLTERRNALEAKIQAEHGQLPARTDVTAQLEASQQAADTAAAEIERLNTLLRAVQEQFHDARKQMMECERTLERLDAHDARQRDLEALDAELAASNGQTDLPALEKAMQEMQADVEARRLQDAHDAAVATAQDARDRAALHNELVTLFRDVLPARLLAEAHLPIEGLSLDDERIVIDGIPLHQLGTSEQIRVGVALAAALNPRSGFVLVDGAESLGRADRLALADSAKELGLQLIMTYVDGDATPGPGVTVMQAGGPTGN